MILVGGVGSKSGDLVNNIDIGHGKIMEDTGMNNHVVPSRRA